ncbi:MAG: translesion error-prone DNA polymerase V autoproteolytic subunit [Candidatus Omnitrophica bacterium]|nr:translesion error-prone DNA polymerase V autoproteolytic subunit [Candidatus Omnitrophota bacterium]
MSPNERNIMPRTVPFDLKFYKNRNDTATSIDPKIPFFTGTISAGFPSPADDHMDKKLDLNELLIQHPAATFFVKVSGNSMEDIGIHDGDTLIVDRALKANDGSVVIAVLNGELTVKRVRRSARGMELVPENRHMRPIDISPEMDLEIWGVVTNVIHRIK